MIAKDRNALLCDFAETYHIYDLRALPVETVATLAAGLRDDSRIKTIIRGETVPYNVVLMATIIDRLNAIIWQNGGGKGSRPQSIAEQLLNPPTKKHTEITAFATPEDFESARRAILGKGA